MDKVVKGWEWFLAILLVQTIGGIVALVKFWQFQSAQNAVNAKRFEQLEERIAFHAKLWEGEVKELHKETAELEKKIEDFSKRADSLRESFHKIETETEIIKVKMTQISEIASEIKSALKAVR